MKKNSTLRVAALLLALTLITSCFVGSTFAKYVTGSSSQDTARIAHWGFDQVAEIDIENLFTHNDSAIFEPDDENEPKRLAPGSRNCVSFAIAAKGVNAPEVAYSLTVSTEGSTENPTLPSNIKWYLGTEEMQEGAATLTYPQLLENIRALSGNYDAGQWPEHAVYYIGWEWPFNGSDQPGFSVDTNDVTTMTGNEVLIKISVVAVQEDSIPTTG